MNRLRESLLRIMDQFSTRHILVGGDFISDEFLYGRIARVSREAPVLVLEYCDLLRAPGGAANAANNLLELGCGVTLVAAVGPDEAGRTLVETLAERGADVGCVREVADYATPVKTRILAGAHHSSPQQVVRIDRVPGPGLGPEVPGGRIRRRLRSFDGIILSDYGYGAVDPGVAAAVVETVKTRRVPVVVDSRFRTGEYRGVTAITPNITELEAAVGADIGSDSGMLRSIGARILTRQRLACLLVTQGRFGMTLVRPRRPAVHIPIFGSDEVADVTGAGDTVIAVFSLALACGADPEDAARLANYAGGIVVMKRGTATVSRDELRAAIEEDLPETGPGHPAD